MPKKHLLAPLNRGKKPETPTMTLHHSKNKRGVVVKVKAEPLSTNPNSKYHHLVTVLGNKRIELTPIAEIEPTVFAATISKMDLEPEVEIKRGKKTIKARKKKIEYTPISEIKPVVYGASKKRQVHKSNLTRFREFIGDIWKAKF